MAFREAATKFVQENMAKIVIGCVVGIGGLLLTQCDSFLTTHDKQQYDYGAAQAEAKQREGVMGNVNRANNAAHGGSLDADRRVRQSFNRCDPDNAARDDNDC